MTEIFNPFSPAFISNPYPSYAKLREVAPVYKTDFGFWAITNAEHVNTVLSDRRFGKGDVGIAMEQQFGESALTASSTKMRRNWMINLNPPQHTRLRNLVVKAFNVARVEALKPSIKKTVNDIIDKHLDDGEMDLISDFAFLIPVTVICDLLGVPLEDRKVFLKESRIPTRLLDPTPMSEAEFASANSDVTYMDDYFSELCEQKRKNPQDDLISALVGAEGENDALSIQEIIDNIILIFGAGHETSQNMIGNSILALHNNPDQLNLLRENPQHIGNAVDELMRYDSPVQIASGRIAFEDCELNGMEIKRGDRLAAFVGAANRDPQVHENPDKLDILREKPKPLSFGGGMHYCLGAHLSRIEASIAIETLIDRVPNMELSERDNPQWLNTITLRGLQTLPAHWS